VSEPFCPALVALVVVAPGSLLQQILRRGDQRVGPPDDLAEDVERARDVERRGAGAGVVRGGLLR